MGSLLDAEERYKIIARQNASNISNGMFHCYMLCASLAAGFRLFLV